MVKPITRRRVLSSAAGLLFTVTPLGALAKAAPEFVAVRIWPANAYTRITLEASQALKYKHFTLSNPSRLVVDIEGSTLNNVLQSINTKVQKSDPYIANIRVGQNTATTVRVVIDLKQTVNPQVFTLAPIANFRNRLVIDLYPSAAVAAAAEANDPLMALLEDYTQGRIRSDGTGSGGNVPPVQDRQPAIVDTPPPTDTRRSNRKPIIVLDPGHGGEDPGAIGPSGLREKNVVLAIARETKKRLDAMGYQTYMTRNEDVFIPLGVRVAKARSLKADIFVSIHADAFTSPSARGTGVYALSTRGATSAAARFLEQTQNNADLIGGVQKVGNKQVDSALLDMTQTATIKDSLVLGRRVLDELGKLNKLHKGYVDQANFAVLRAPDIPSILVETAFLSNPTEEKLLASASFRQQSANAIAQGIRSYLSNAVLARR
ncbi:N-acetylmuramoyl-L-alanine amidase [Neisseria arctica]|uniref:N-acetylmuramoyl-L-alanine amidase AmiC n=1 Tax=Neisseria arctica TaxID=1470200 RepID=A0A0J0YQZ4_9NEIS|nr:N-acetylmuramoyl-L-alanine amidase [Neisseria arctica]KLT72555.1 N-acetylmuramoyl-L-alanine amidase [Neisseria arctica]UOO87609.1 N-acetylmuramoyl-L-alanine amidase [Neisseria arctica]